MRFYPAKARLGTIAFPHLTDSAVGDVHAGTSSCGHGPFTIQSATKQVTSGFP